MEPEKRRLPNEVLAEIQRALASIDGIATADAFRIGNLVHEYGSTCAGKASLDIIGPLLDAMVKKPQEPWEKP